MSENTPKYPTAFLMIKNEDGTWMASTDITRALQTERVANRLDIRQGCQELVNVITHQDMAATILAILDENLMADTQRETPDVRDASTGSTPEN